MKCPFRRKPLFEEMGRGTPVCVCGFYFPTDVSLCITHTRCHYCQDRKARCGPPSYTTVPRGVRFLLCEKHSSVWNEHSMLLRATRWETQHEQVTCNFPSCSLLSLLEPWFSQVSTERAECLQALSTFFFPLFIVGSEKTHNSS